MCMGLVANAMDKDVELVCEETIRERFDMCDEDNLIINGRECAIMSLISAPSEPITAVAFQSNVALVLRGHSIVRGRGPLLC